MLKAKKIWLGNTNDKDNYVDFTTTFVVDGNEEVVLKTTFDSSVQVFVNGNLALFGENGDFPQDKLYYEKKITAFCKQGENVIDFTVYHMGLNTLTYINQPAFLAFEIAQGDKVIARSSSKTKARINQNFKNGYCQLITGQLGYSYYYDSTVEASPYTNAVEVGDIVARKRPIAPMKTVKSPKAKITKTDFGYLVDLGKETVGYLSLDIDCEKEECLEIRFGEHLFNEGRVSAYIDGRRFVVEYKAKNGRNTYQNFLRRLACRYFEIITTQELDIHSFGLVAAEYPVKKIKKTFDDSLWQKIYDTSVYTLQCCMHEHYEDCPWREQALYGMDSRNQMLCGYYAFEGTGYQKHSLELMASSLREDGMLNMCAPSGVNLVIPFFTLCYFLGAYEYTKYAKKPLTKKIRKTLDKVFDTFTNNIDDTGLIRDFASYWNFYEWSDGSNGNITTVDENGQKVMPYDLILNCMYVYIAGLYGEISGKTLDLSSTRKAITETFYDNEKKMFKLSTEGNKYGQLGNALALLIGLGDEALAEKLIEKDNGMVPATLSMTAFVYDALLKTDSKYREYILSDIRKKYTKMLDAGATTFWETELGWKDFANAGSLCHGWSAIPIYYLNLLGE